MRRLTGVFVAGSVRLPFRLRAGRHWRAEAEAASLETVGVYELKDDHDRRQRALEEIQRERADSIESAIHRSNAP